MSATAKIDGKPIQFDGEVWRYVIGGKQVEQFSKDGTLCQGCGRVYRLDLILSNSLWERIKPPKKPEGAGLLCAECIVARLEALFGFCVFAVELR